MDWTTICRTCLTECDKDKLYSMLTMSNDSIDLWTVYDSIMNVGQHVDSVVVPYICIKCMEDLKTAYFFKLMCTETETTLSELATIDESDNESKIEVKIDVSGNESEIEYVYEDFLEDSGAEEEDGKSEEKYNTDNVNTVVAVINDTNDAEVGSDVLKPDEKKRKCRACNIQFDSKKAHRDHYTEFHRRVYIRKINNNWEKGRKCTACNIQFEKLKEYLVHYRRNHARKPSRSKVLCTHCGNLYSKTSIAKHIKAKHSAIKDRKRHSCETCDKSYSRLENLIMHKRTHTNDKRYVCEYCGEKFMHWTSRRNHIRSKHTFEKNYECNICNAKFSNSSAMYCHIRRHKNEMKHFCTFCQKGFSTTTELKNHQIVHTKEKNEICEVCQKCFGTRKNLLVHMKIHSNERNYVCWVCDKRFTRPHALRTHLSTHPGVEMPERGALLSQKALSRMENVSATVGNDEK